LNKNFNSLLAFVLHFRAYKETSLLVDFFTRDLGRITTVAKGVKRPKSLLKPVLVPTSLLNIDISGKRELKTLKKSEIVSHFSLSSNSQINSILYLNELLIKFIEKEDPHPLIFDRYTEVLSSLENKIKTGEVEAELRSFELLLLEELGYGIDLYLEANTGKKIQESSTYFFDPMKGFLINSINEITKKDLLFSGQDILNIAKGDFSSDKTRVASKRILRAALDTHLGKKDLNIRKFFS